MSSTKGKRIAALAFLLALLLPAGPARASWFSSAWHAVSSGASRAWNAVKAAERAAERAVEQMEAETLDTFQRVAKLTSRDLAAAFKEAEKAGGELAAVERVVVKDVGNFAESEAKTIGGDAAKLAKAAGRTASAGFNIVESAAEETTLAAFHELSKEGFKAWELTEEGGVWAFKQAETAGAWLAGLIGVNTCGGSSAPMVGTDLIKDMKEIAGKSGACAAWDGAEMVAAATELANLASTVEGLSASAADREIAEEAEKQAAREGEKRSAQEIAEELARERQIEAVKAIKKTGEDIKNTATGEKQEAEKERRKSVQQAFGTRVMQASVDAMNLSSPVGVTRWGCGMTPGCCVYDLYNVPVMGPMYLCMRASQAAAATKALAGKLPPQEREPRTPPETRGRPCMDAIRDKAAAYKLEHGTCGGLKKAIEEAGASSDCAQVRGTVPAGKSAIAIPPYSHLWMGNGCHHDIDNPPPAGQEFAGSFDAFIRMADNTKLATKDPARFDREAQRLLERELAVRRARWARQEPKLTVTEAVDLVYKAYAVPCIFDPDCIAEKAIRSPFLGPWLKAADGNGDSPLKTLGHAFLITLSEVCAPSDPHLQYRTWDSGMWSASFQMDRGWHHRPHVPPTYQDDSYSDELTYVLDGVTWKASIRGGKFFHVDTRTGAGHPDTVMDLVTWDKSSHIRVTLRGDGKGGYEFLLPGGQAVSSIGYWNPPDEKWSASWDKQRGQWHISSAGLGHDDVILDYLTWDGGKWRVKIVPDGRFLHAPDGDFSRAHYESYMDYLGWDGKRYRSTLKTYLDGALKGVSFVTRTCEPVEGKTIHQAAYDGDVARVKEILDAACDQANARDGNGDTPLLLAGQRSAMSGYGDTGAFRTLLNAGADLTAVNHAGDTVLGLLLYKSRYDSLRWPTIAALYANAEPGNIGDRAKFAAEAKLVLTDQDLSDAAKAAKEAVRRLQKALP